MSCPDILSRLHDLEQAVALLQRGAAATTPQAPEACRRALAQEPSGLLGQVTAAVAHAHGNRFPDEHYRPLAKRAVIAVERWLSDKELDGAAAVLRREVERG
jgi:hypothetical protein